MTSSVARSSCVISPGTSSIWEKREKNLAGVWCPASPLEEATYDEVAGLVGAGEESGWMSVHLVLESGWSAIFGFSSQNLPELICEEKRHIMLIHNNLPKWGHSRRRMKLNRINYSSIRNSNYEGTWRQNPKVWRFGCLTIAYYIITYCGLLFITSK